MRLTCGSAGTIRLGIHKGQACGILGLSRTILENEMTQSKLSTTTDPRFSQPDEETARILRAMIEITSAFRELSPTIPVAYMEAFLVVCLKPGGGSTDYMKDMGTIQPIMSRMLLTLGNKERRKPADESGYKLVETSPDPLDMRRNRTFLTAKGKTLLNRVVRQIQRLGVIK